MKFRDLQHVFDTALEGIRKQGRPSLRAIEDSNYGPGKCCYLGDGGDGCALGQLTDNHGLRAQWDKNRYSYQYIASLLTIEQPYDRYELVSLLGRMQCAHDMAQQDSQFMLAFEASMANIAAHFNLQYKSPTGGKEKLGC